MADQKLAFSTGPRRLQSRDKERLRLSVTPPERLLIVMALTLKEMFFSPLQLLFAYRRGYTEGDSGKFIEQKLNLKRQRISDGRFVL